MIIATQKSCIQANGLPGSTLASGLFGEVKNAAAYAPMA